LEYAKTLPRKIWLRAVNESLLSEIVFVLVVVVWGVTFVFSKNALDVVGPFTYNTIRMGLGALTLALLAGSQWRLANRAYIWPALLTGLVLAASYGTQAYGQQFTTASKAGFLTGTNLVYVPLFSAVLLKRMPTRMALAGVALAFVGLVLLSVEPGQFSLSPGDFWVALSGVGWALYFIVLARFSPGLNVMLYAALHVAVAAALNGVGWALFEPWAVPWGSAALWVGVLTTGVLVIGLGTGVQTWITRRVSPTRVALIAALEPVFAAMAGWWIGELITPRMVVGGALIVAGMLVAEFSPRQGRR